MALAGLLLLLGATAWLSEPLFVGTAVAQSGPTEPTLRPAQRRLLTQRLKDRLKALQRDFERGQQLVRSDLANWRDDQRNPTVARIFDPNKPARPLPDGADNIYEAMLKAYGALTDLDDEPWNPWPEDKDVQYQRDYVDCVRTRIDQVFERRWKVLSEVIGWVNQDKPLDELRKSIRNALTFNEGILQDYMASDLPLAETSDLDLKRIFDTLNTCPIRGPSERRKRAVNTLPLSVGWNEKCLQSDTVRRDGTVKPYHPTTAALMYNDGPSGYTTYCSGTLIAPNAVLTAAHCMCDTGAKDPRGSFYRTAGACVNGSYSRLGRGVPALDPKHQSVFLQHAGRFEVSHIVVHPQFRWTGQLPVSDLAIVFLKAPVPAITPMQLNTLGWLPPRTKAAAVGYGAHNPIGASGSITDTRTVLEVAGLKLQANTETGSCGLYGRSRKLICWRYQPTDRFGMRLGSTCRGDSGGPLYAELRGQTYLVGVTSGGGPSCQPDTKAFDIEVYAYRNWIERQLMLNPPPRGNGPLSAASPGRDDHEGMTQIACHFCPLCAQLSSAPIEVPDNARRLHIAVNCTPNDIARRSEPNELTLSASFEPDPKWAELCPPDPNAAANPQDPKATPKSTALSCRFDVPPAQEPRKPRSVHIKLDSGLLQQCQIVATAFDR